MDVREKLAEMLAEYFNIGDSYAYNLTRVKSAFACGTVGLDDFEEFDDETVENIASYLIDNGVTVQEQDGCDYCQLFDDPCGVPMIAQEESESDRGIYLYNGFLCANGGEFCEARVNFCPMCGRKLLQQPKGE